MKTSKTYVYCHVIMHVSSFQPLLQVEKYFEEGNLLMFSRKCAKECTEDCTTAKPETYVEYCFIQCCQESLCNSALISVGDRVSANIPWPLLVPVCGHVMRL